jgi:hypothetical protein
MAALNNGIHVRSAHSCACLRAPRLAALSYPNGRSSPPPAVHFWTAAQAQLGTAAQDAVLLCGSIIRAVSHTAPALFAC